MRTATFKIDGMHCEACAESIKKRLAAIAGVRAAEVSFTDRTARVLYQPETLGEAQLVMVIEKPGYRVVGVT
jgi:copper chaperone CopZ